MLLDQAEGIKYLLKQLYQLKEAEFVSVINHNPLIIKVRDREMHYFLKFNRALASGAEYRTIRHAAIQWLNHCGVLTPQTYPICINYCNNGICTKAGDKYFIYQQCCVELYEWLDFDGYMDSLSAFESTIDLLVVVATFLPQMPYPALHPKQQVVDYITNRDLPVREFLPYYQKFISDWVPIIVRGLSLTDNYEVIALGKLAQDPFIFVHADFNLKNVGYINQQAKYILDLERVKKGFQIEDTAMLFFELCIKDQKLEETFRRSTLFSQYLHDRHHWDFDLKYCLYCIATRMLRHIYRGIENRVANNRDFPSFFYTVFLEGLKRTISFWEQCIESPIPD